MPTLIKLTDGRFTDSEDVFAEVADDAVLPDGPVILSLTRFQTEGDALIGANRPVGVRIAPDESVEDLAYDLPRLALVAVAFPKFGDGRGYSSAALLRQRLGFTGEVRAVGEVLREQALFLTRCGFDAFAVSDGSTAEQWAAAVGRFRHVYQRAVDRRAPAFEERQ